MTNWNWSKDLNNHPTGGNRKQAKLSLDKICISIVGGEGLYGNGDTTFEVGIQVDGGSWNVKGWNDVVEVDHLVREAIKFNDFLTEFNG